MREPTMVDLRFSLGRWEREARRRARLEAAGATLVHTAAQAHQVCEGLRQMIVIKAGK